MSIFSCFSFMKCFVPFHIVERMLAFRYLRSRRTEGATSLITGISFLGITLGVAALIVVMSVMNGFREELLTRLLGVNGHIIIQSINPVFKDYDSITNRMNALPYIKQALPLIEGTVLVRGGEKAGTGAIVRGIYQKDLEKIKLVSENIREGEVFNFDKDEGVIIGQGIAESLDLSVGDTIAIIFPEGDSTPMGTVPRVKGYPVKAIYQVGMSDYDGAVIYMPFQEAQLYFNMQNNAHFIEIYLKKPDNPKSIKFEIEKVAGDGVIISDWQERNESFFVALQMEKSVMFLILSLIILIAALNTVSGLIMLVSEKGYDIAILRTMGATKSSILRVFLLTGTMIGASGTLFGVLIGCVICINVESIRQFLSWVSGTVLFSPELYFLSELPAKINPNEIFLVVLMTLALTFLSSLLPAWRASRLDPIEALRYE